MLNDRIEAAIQRHICSAAVQGPAPTGLHKAIDYSVFPGGARIRPVILTSVAMACGDDQPTMTDAAAAALEFIHCASLCIPPLIVQTPFASACQIRERSAGAV